MLQRIIELGSNPNDLVLDFYSGSGTSAAVAHKMGGSFHEAYLGQGASPEWW